jgi:hypothetical protein
MSRWGFLIGIVWLVLMPGCEYVEALFIEDDQVQKSIVLEPFEEVVIGTSVNLILCNDSIFRADVKGLAFVLSRLKIEQKGGILYIESEGTDFRKMQAPVITLHATSYKKLTSNFASMVGVKDTLQTDVFTMIINGGGSFTQTNLAIKANSFSFSCYGSNVGIHVIKGVVENFNVISEGLTTIDARELEADKVQFVQRSISPAYIYAREALAVKMESSGDVFFWGNPQINVDYQPPAYKVELGQVMSGASVN